jgi:hypothetical protein
VPQISGKNNWVETGSDNEPDEWTGTVSGTDPGFEDVLALDLRPAAGSPLLDAGTSTPAPPPGFPFPNPLFPPMFHPPARTVAQGPPPPPRPLAGLLDLGAFEASPVFADGFESGDTSAWSGQAPPP